jgi:hypothetical protein
MKENIDSLRLKQFLKASLELTNIPGVINFKSWKQVSEKNAFQYGLSMEFATLEQYQQYNHHPTHVAFINEQWIPCVADFLEIDYEPITADFF